MILEEGKNLSILESASLAGFHIPSERSKVFMPQFEWIMNEAKLLDSVNLIGLEPANIFTPQNWIRLTKSDEYES